MRLEWSNISVRITLAKVQEWTILVNNWSLFHRNILTIYSNIFKAFLNKLHNVLYLFIRKLFWRRCRARRFKASCRIRWNAGFTTIVGNIGSIYGEIGGAAPHEIRQFRMPFPSIAANRRLALESLAAKRRYPPKLGRLSEMEFCHEAPLYLIRSLCSASGDEKYPGRALYVLPELWNPRGAKRDLAHMHARIRPCANLS